MTNQSHAISHSESRGIVNLRSLVDSTHAHAENWGKISHVQLNAMTTIDQNHPSTQGYHPGRNPCVGPSLPTQANSGTRPDWRRDLDAIDEACER
jgi:hypothetical protein